MQYPTRPHSALSRALLPALALFSLPSVLLAEGTCDGLTTAECRSFSTRNVFALIGNNAIASVYGSNVISIVNVRDIEGTLIGIDFRPAEVNAARNTSLGLYGLSDTGKIYRLDMSGGPVAAELVSSLGTPFDGGLQSLMDFNPVANALRVIGSNDQNYAVVNSNGNLNATAVQTAISYAAGDPQAGRDPNLTAGAYNNNVAGATATIFYALDYARDTLVTIADVTNGSSATGAGRLKTIGRLVDRDGNAVNVLPEAGMDIYSDPSIGNGALIANGQDLYFLNLSTVNANAAVGTTRNVVVTKLDSDINPIVRGFTPAPGAFTDVAVSPQPVLATAADIDLRQEGDFGPFVNGTPYTIEVKVTNRGPDNQNGVIFSSTGLPFKDPVVSPSQGSCTVGALSAGGRQLQCSLGNLASGATATVKIVVRRVADDSVGDERLVSTFFASGPGGGLVTFDGDPYGNNNKLLVTIFQ